MTTKAKTRAERTLARLSNARREAILDERTQRLAARAAQTPGASRPALRLLACPVGANLYGLPLGEVAAIRRFDRHGAAPATTPAVVALVADAGRIRPVLDLPTLLGAAGGAPTGGWLAVLAAPHGAALRLDELPAAVDAEPLSGADSGRARILSAGAFADRTLVLLSAADLLAALPASALTQTPSSPTPGARAS